MAQLELGEITQGISKQRGRWVVRDHPLLHLTDDEKPQRLGLLVDKDRLREHQRQPKPDLARFIAEYSVRQGEQRARERGPGAMTAAPARADAVQKAIAGINAVTALRAEVLDLVHVVPWPFWWLFVVDWRDRWGVNYVTAVTDQGGCGSCVAFGTIGTMESMVLIEHNVATDLSEAELLFCGGGSCGGWWPDNAVAYLKKDGVAQESCFPYQDHNMPCQTCSRRDGEAIKVTNGIVITDAVQRKDYLFFIGPMMAAFAVYDDFFGYSSGVYSHVAGSLAGYHCVEVIGYDDYEGCWICKNSWSSGWGDQGFFRIAYGQCEIDSTFPFWGISGSEWWT
jgi:hypothetical protein